MIRLLRRKLWRDRTGDRILQMLEEEGQLSLKDLGKRLEMGEGTVSKCLVPIRNRIMTVQAGKEVWYELRPSELSE